MLHPMLFSFALLLILLLELSYGFFIPCRTNTRIRLGSNTHNRLHAPSTSVEQILFSILNERNTTESLIKIIEYGDKFWETSTDTLQKQFSNDVIQHNPFLIASETLGWSKVPGCLSDVRVKASIDLGTNIVEVVGVADSRVARGLLAVLCNVRIVLYNIIYLVCISSHE